jgi:hypothetical protein
MRIASLVRSSFIIDRMMDAERNALHRVNSAVTAFCACTEDMQGPALRKNLP